jgi:hypothetical protein
LKNPVSPEAKLIKEYVSLVELYDGEGQEALGKIWVARVGYVAVKAVGQDEAYLSVPDNVRSFVKPENAYGVVVQHSRGGLHGNEYGFGFGLHVYKSGGIQMYWVSEGYGTVEAMVGAGPDEIVLMVIGKQGIRLRTGRPTDLKAKGFELPIEDVYPDVNV